MFSISGRMVLRCPMGPVCREMFTTKEELKKHYHAEHGIIRNRACADANCPVCTLFWCEWCDYHTYRWDFVTKHRRQHFEELPFACEVCSFRGQIKEDLLKHRSTHHSVQESAASASPAVVIQWELIREAVTTVTAYEVMQMHTTGNTKRFPCVVATCNHGSDTEEAMLSHAQSHAL